MISTKIKVATPIPTRVVGRLCLYRRLLIRSLHEGTAHIYSHELAGLAGASAAQVRRDLMTIGFEGSPKRGYSKQGLIDSIGHFLDDPQGQRLALVGVGLLGRSIINYFVGKRPNLTIAAAFDIDPQRVNRVIHGCHCHPVDELAPIVRAQGISVGIITVPAGVAQNIADRLVEGGVRSIVNFAPVALRVPDGVYVQDIDITTTLETAAFFARRQD